MPVSTTEISTEGGRLPMVWWEQPEAADELAIVLPGQWFGCASPPTAYATLALQELGADVAWVNYAYDREPGFERRDKAEQEERLFHDARAGVETALARCARERYVVVGKSFGTLAMSQLMDEGRLTVGMRTIWLTPMLRDQRVSLRPGGARSARPARHRRPGPSLRPDVHGAVVPAREVPGAGAGGRKPRAHRRW